MEQKAALEHIDIVAMYVQAYEKYGEDKEKAKVEFCNNFLKILQKVRGEDLAPHLSDVRFYAKTKNTTLTLTF